MKCVKIAKKYFLIWHFDVMNQVFTLLLSQNKLHTFHYWGFVNMYAKFYRNRLWISLFYGEKLKKVNSTFHQFLQIKVYNQSETIKTIKVTKIIIYTFAPFRQDIICDFTN